MKNKLKFSLIGDIALNGLFTTDPGKNKERFSEIIPILEDSDFVFANLETPIKDGENINEYKIKKDGIIMYTTENVVQEILPCLNISAVSLANNHIYDYKDAGARKTINVLDKLNIKHTGAGKIKHHTEPVFCNKNGIKIAFIAYVDKNTNPGIPNSSNIYINYYNEDEIINEIKKLKETVDLIIVSVHWGIDYSYYPTRYQREICREFINHGADIIMGHHTHTLQPFEKYKGKYIFYSLGQLCLGDSYQSGKFVSIIKKCKRSVITNINVTEDKNIFVTYQSIKELKGNKIITTNWNYKKWTKLHSRIMKLKHKFSLINVIINIKESFFDRIIEYFFGYYQNPLIKLLMFSNYRKIIFLFKDYSWRRNRTI